jgi:inorganic pyrophosphatase
MKKMIIRDKLLKLIGEEVTIYIDRPIGSRHPNHQDIVYGVNYGYIKEIIALDNEYQDAYLLGVDEPIKKVKGKVYAVVERENDVEDKLIIVAGDKEYTTEEIKNLIKFQEQYFKYKIVR